MEGAYYLIMKLIVAEGAICVAATCRFLLSTRNHTKRNFIDSALLATQILIYIFCMPVLINELYRNRGVIEQAMLDASILFPLTAAVLAQLAMFMRMGRG